MNTIPAPLRAILRALCFCFVYAVASATAATLTVTKTADTNDGACDADCSLREAIAAAASGDTIVFATPLFATPQTITLSETAGLQQLRILKHLTITGPGAHLLTIRRGPEATARFRIFDVEGQWIVNLIGMTITGGNVTDASGIAEDAGGGLRNYEGAVTLVDCHVTNNTAHFGGGIHNRNFGHVTVINSAITNNTATAGPAGGGGIESSATLIVTNSTISGNVKKGGGANYGGGIFSSGGTATITNSTITANRTEGQVNATAGLFIFGSGSLLIRNTIVSDSQNYGLRVVDVMGTTTSQGYNFIGNAGSTAGFTQPGDQRGSNEAPLDPRLDPLALNGGTTPTHHLRADSLAIDKGKSFGSTTDQRGAVRPFNNPLVANAAGGDASDIGAYEAPTFWVVTKTEDTNDGICGEDCSLREALVAAASGDDIIFATPLFSSPQTIALSAAGAFRDLVVAKNLSIIGPGANLLTINVPSGGGFRVFNINGSGVQVRLSGLTISGGNAVSSNGGGINVNSGAALTISSCRISANTANRGAGCYVASDSSLTLLDSTVSGNSDTGSPPTAPGIHNEGTLVVTNSTISGNVNFGGFSSCGGIWSSGTATITNATVTDNFAGGGGTPGPVGGVCRTAGTVTIRNSIVAANRNNATLPDVVGSFVSFGYNLIGNVGAATGFTQPGDQTGTGAAPINPQLDPLAYNLGPTQTHRLQLTSPALDQGHSSGSFIDQRGRPRPSDNPAVANAMGGDGADIGAFETPLFLVVTKTADTNDNFCDTDCSLREAINTAAPGDEITFAAPLFDAPQIITLAFANGNLVINKSLNITGKGAHLLTIRQTSGLFRLFNINGSGVQVGLSHLTLRGGTAAGANGGGINANGGVALTLSHCHITDNRALRGGGLFVTADSSLTLLHSTVSGNITGGSGGTGSTAGGIHNEGLLSIINSTISGNIENTGGNTHGGGLWTNGTTTISHSTITDNQAAGMNSASGIFQGGGTLTISNSIVGDNRENLTVPDVAGAFTSSGFNLIGNVGSATGFTPGDQIGNSASVLNPFLDVLGSYGGTTPTHRLQGFSTAIDKGHSFGSLLDQAGRMRPVDLAPSNVAGGDGADIGAWEAQFLPLPAVVSAVSRKVHGSSGTFDIDLPLTGTPGVECRSAGAGNSHQVVVTFANPVTLTGASIMSIDGMASGTPSTVGTVVTINLSAVSNSQTLGITLTGVNDGTASGDVFIPLGVLAGDTNGSGAVGASDIGQVKSQSGQPVTTANFRADVTISGGTINASDLGLVKSRSGTALP